MTVITTVMHFRDYSLAWLNFQNYITAKINSFYNVVRKNCISRGQFSSYGDIFGHSG